MSISQRRAGLRRGFYAVLGLTLLVALATASAGSAGNAPVATGTDFVSTPFTPLGLSKAPATVVVQLAGKSVAEEKGDDDSSTQLSSARENQIKRDLKGKQDSLKPAIEQLGGTVLADYQSAYNGVKVEIARNKVDALSSLPGVVGVHAVMAMERDNSVSVPFIGAPSVWDGAAGFRGEGVKVAIIDTGIDYTHADFGGPGTAAAFAAADATDTLPANASLFGPAAPKVKGGIDLVGDAYDASADAGSPALIPHPDPNPLDCNGHGTHVAGTAVGFGVKADGTTFHGPYNAATHANNTFSVGPGVAPLADLYSIRVFGCEGSTDVTVDAIDWAVDHHMDVINMSLGSPFGGADDPSAVAAENAAKAGIIVVASAGNSGAGRYITGSPASGNGVLSVAATDSTAKFPGANLTFGATTIQAINANNHPFTSLSLTIKTIRDNAATPTRDESLGCSVADFGVLGPNTLAVVNRGVCARVAKAIFGQQAGAAAVAMVNNATNLPPFEGPITSNPDDGVPFNVTIPFLGVRGLPTTPTSDGGKLRAADGAAVSIAATLIDNPTFRAFADFTSGGPRTGDSALKPNISAPGVSIRSAAVGTGNGGTTLSGTSMAAPHVTGVAALVRQAHPTWKKGVFLTSAIADTGDPAGVAGFGISRGGSGLVQPLGATRTQAVAFGSQRNATLNFGFAELGSDFSKDQSLKVRNLGNAPITFTLSATNASGSPHSVSFDRPQITLGPGDDADVDVTLNVPAATAGNSAAFREVAGVVTLSPNAGQNNGVTLRVPYYLVPRALSNVETSVAAKKLSAASPSTVATLTNAGGAIAGDADFYAWGLEDKKDKGKVSNDLRAVGVQSFANPSAADPNRRLLVFAVSTWDRWSNATTNEFDIGVDVDNDGKDDYVVVGADLGALTAGAFNGTMASAVFSTRSLGASIAFLADAPTDSTTLLLPLRTSQLCRTAPLADGTHEPCLSKTANPRFTYHAAGFDLLAGGADEAEGFAKFNAWSSSISQGDFQTIAPGGTATSTVTVDPAEFALTPAKGIMVVTHDDKAGKAEADLVPIELR